MELYDYIGNETSNREYKICSLTLNDTFSSDKAVECLKSGKWIFNDIIKESLSMYMRKYLAKYVASFSSVMTVKEGDVASLYIGVDDDGYVSGIPYEGILDITFLKEIIDDIFNSTLVFKDNTVKERIREKLNIELIHVKYNKTEISVGEDLYDLFLTETKKRSEAIGNYKRISAFWSNITNSQNRKLSEMLNEENHKYRSTRYYDDFLPKKKYHHVYSHLYGLCDVPNYHDMMADLRIANFQAIDKQEINTYKSIVECQFPPVVPSYNFNRVYILNNFAKYKDYNIAVYSSFKQKRPPKNKVNNNFSKFLLSQVHRMMNKWIVNNDLNIYVLRIDIPLAVTEKGDVKCFNEKKRKFETCYRGNDKNGPTTITI